jgi:hypothetical protein
MFSSQNLCKSLIPGSPKSISDRLLEDLPLQGTSVTIKLELGRCRCRNRKCELKLLTERVPAVLVPQARQTVRLREIRMPVSRGLGGPLGRRLLSRLGWRPVGTRCSAKSSERHVVVSRPTYSASWGWMPGARARVSRSARSWLIWNAAKCQIFSRAFGWELSSHCLKTSDTTRLSEAVSPKNAWHDQPLDRKTSTMRDPGKALSEGAAPIRFSFEFAAHN